MAANFYFFYQQKGGEDEWRMALSSDRTAIVAEKRPAFTTVLDLNLVPDDGDWSKTRYRGPLYFDFDAGDDLPLVCDQFLVFLAKLDTELNFDIGQARLYASGSKGFHVEIPQECFTPKVSPQGVPWLPYVYREVAQSLMVDTLDLKVYTGKRGRMWRTMNVQRDNGNYKVPLSIEEALSITPDLYRELIKQPRQELVSTPPSCNTSFAMLFERSREKLVTQMRGKKKRQEQSNRLLDPWKRAKKNPPTIEMIMAGENIADGVGFQQIAMQLAIYAASVGMPMPEFLDRCKGLCETHVSDGTRYNTPGKRREELSRMYRYMEENTLYDFDTGPLARLVKPGVPITDLGVMDTEDRDDVPVRAQAQSDEADGDAPSAATLLPTEDLHRGVRKGFFMNGDGMWKKSGPEGNGTESVCRATLRNVESFYDIEKHVFAGYEFDVVVKGRRSQRAMLSAEAFTSAQNMKKFFVAHQLSYQGGESETAALLDIMSEKSARNGRVYVYPREGFFIVNHPESDEAEPIKVYLTQDRYISSIPEGDERFFRLRYRPTQAMSAYNIDIHRAPELGDEHKATLHDLFNFTRPETLADLLGWFVAAHYRGVYMHLFHQFPLLQIYGEAGAGKTQTVLLLAHLHWYLTEISIKSATSFTNFALDSHASSSTSAPLIMDEYKPKELRSHKGKYEKVKDVLKACYVGADIGERGTLNKVSDSPLSIVKSKATAPIVFMGEAIEMETAIIERCVTVNLSKAYITNARKQTFERLQADPTALSALGRTIVEMGFALNLDAMRQEVRDIQAAIETKLPAFDDPTHRRLAPRLIFNRAVIIHALQTLKSILARKFGTEFNAEIDNLLGTRAQTGGDEARVLEIHSMSEISKVLSRIALLSRDVDMPYEMRLGKDYQVGDGWMEMRVERAYDQYRRYCASISDSPLFDNLDAFTHALNSYSAVIDRVCASSDLRPEGSTERIVRFDLSRLRRESVQAFRQ